MSRNATEHEAERRILVGPAGWSYEDWKGAVYPTRPPRGFDALRWVARFFDLVEVNASFYRVPPPRLASAWVERTRDQERPVFSVKVHRDLTHGERRIEAATVRSISDFVEPLRQARRLGPLLAQFPWSLRPSLETLEHLGAVREAFPELDVVFELRHGDWGRVEWAGRLAERGLDLVSVDQPQVGNALGPGPRAGRVAYVRLHGRNRATWFARDAGRDARYDYLYALDELRDWVATIHAMVEDLGRVHVVTNNHFRGQAVVNALELRRLLGLPVQEVPAGLLREFPEVRTRWERRGWRPRPIDPNATALRGDESPPRQGELF